MESMNLTWAVMLEIGWNRTFTMTCWITCILIVNPMNPPSPQLPIPFLALTWMKRWLTYCTFSCIHLKGTAKRSTLIKYAYNFPRVLFLLDYRTMKVSWVLSCFTAIIKLQLHWNLYTASCSSHYPMQLLWLVLFDCALVCVLEYVWIIFVCVCVCVFLCACTCAYVQGQPLAYAT